MQIVTLSGQIAKGWHTDDLRRAALLQGHEFHAIGWPKLTAEVGKKITADDLDLEQANIILPRTMPPASLEQIVFRMDLLAQLANRGPTILNPPRAMEIAIDKYLALQLLHQAGLLTPATIVCQNFDEAMKAFEQLGGDVLVKPIFGSEGVGISRVNDRGLAERIFAALCRIQATLYIQKTIDHDGRDLRLFVLGDQVICSIARESDSWQTNIARGGKAVRFTPDKSLIEMAVRAAACCQCAIAGVDLLPAKDGRIYAIEVNAAPGWRAISKVTGIDIAAAIIDFATGATHA